MNTGTASPAGLDAERAALREQHGELLRRWIALVKDPGRAGDEPRHAAIAEAWRRHVAQLRRQP
jgi:hypothetical protein